PGIGASELQPLIWQLLELTLRPEYHHHHVAGVMPPPPPLPHPMAASGSLLRGSSGGGGSGDPEGSSRSVGAVVVAGTNASSGSQGDHLTPAAAAMAEGSALGVGGGAWSSPSPADLLIAKGLVGSDAVVEMAQDLLSPAADAEARQRTSSVLHHLWASSAAESRPEVVRRLAAYLPFAARQGSRAIEWLSFVALAVQDAQPPLPPTPTRALTTEQLSDGDAMDEDKGGGDGDISPMVALVRAAAAAVAEQAEALSNHPNAALYAAIGRLVPGGGGGSGAAVGHFLELEPCLVCAEQESSSSSLMAASKATTTAAAAEAESLAVAGSRSG
ncbi:unnamed protein product, partial [Ectocarpus fasciculatus]